MRDERVVGRKFTKKFRVGKGPWRLLPDCVLRAQLRIETRVNGSSAHS